MDANIILGNHLLPKVVSFLTVMVKLPENTSSHPPKIGSTGYDLGILSLTDQAAWLKTLQVIMYKVTVEINRAVSLSHENKLQMLQVQ